MLLRVEKLLQQARNLVPFTSRLELESFYGVASYLVMGKATVECSQLLVVCILKQEFLNETCTGS